MNHQVIVGIGEILWDVFPDGPRFGGAPANFACHAAGHGAAAEMVGAVGADDLGRQALEILRQRGVGTGAVQRHDDRPTGTVTVSLDSDGHASYVFAADAAWDALEWSDALADLAGQASAVCFGTLGQRGERSRRTIQRFVSATMPTALRVFDVNLRPPFFDDSVILESLALANILKLNDDELVVLSNLCGLSGSELERAQALADRFALRAVALTRGRKGALLVQGREYHEQAGEAVPVVDTVGAGDAFTATLVVGMLAGHTLEAINRDACRVAGFVCSQPGATPTIPNHLRIGL